MGVSRHIEFEGATVVRFNIRDSSLELEMKDVVLDGQRARGSRAVVTVSPASKIEIDGDISNVVVMAANDGEIIDLEITDNSLLLIIEWNDFSRRKSFTKSYRVLGENISVSVR